MGGQRLEAASRGFIEAIADAHAAYRRPRCMCVIDGVEMYVARLAGTSEDFVVKRMPNTGSHHAPDCPHCEPPPESSGLGQLLGSAITEDPATGVTTLKLDFAMSKIAGRSAMPTSGGDGAEVKEIVPARYGVKAVLKHVPDQGFAMDETLYRRLGRRFESALALWGAADDIHIVMIATFSVAAAGVPTIVELSLMPVTRHWLPLEDVFDKQLIERLVSDGRFFVKGLRYNLGAERALARATLTDCEGSAPSLFVVRAGIDYSARHREVCDLSAPVWLWNPSSEAMPALPPRQQHHQMATGPAIQCRGIGTPRAGAEVI